MIQHVFAQRYELLEHIGGGGMADVYRAHDKLLDRYVAVKILHAQFSNDAEFIEKFHREAQGAAKLSHPNIVNIYDVGEEGDNHYIVMEYVAGDTLKNRIQKAGHLSAAESLRVAREIASALEHAHQNNLVHCDIKPHNILMTPDGRVKVADFGIARAVTASTMTYSGNVVGSVHYFSPEQAKGSMITPKSDIYSLGVVLYEMLTGRLPFTGETSVGIALKHLQEEPVSVRQVDPSIPPVVEAIVVRAMAKDPEQRPDSSAMVYEIQQAEGLLYQQTVPGAPADPFATQMLPRVSADQAAPPVRRSRADGGRSDSSKSVLKSKKFIFGLLTILVLGFCVGSFMAFGKFWSSEEVVVPDVVGKQMALAKQTLETQKLRVNVAETYDASVPAGYVVSQSPEAGSKVKEQRMVTIYVSKGGEELEMPDLKGMTKDSAVEKLKKMGVNIGTVYEKYSDEESGTVIAQDPKAGSKISKGQSVDITVSKGKQTKKHTMPDFTGNNVSSARSNITNMGFRVGNVTQKESSKAEGTVLSQSPAAGSEVAEGASVDLVIAAPAKNSREDPGKQNDNKNNTPKKNDNSKTK